VINLAGLEVDVGHRLALTHDGVRFGRADDAVVIRVLVHVHVVAFDPIHVCSGPVSSSISIRLQKSLNHF
jgi:hypothetical protein